MTVLITDKKEIDRIISTKIRGKKLIFTNYYKFGIMKRDIDHKTVLEVFPQFDKIFEIEKDKLKFGDVGYELFYRLSNNQYFSIATCPKDKNLLIIHAISYKRSLDRRFKKS
ncbi:MAG: hypothetical protein ABIB79_00920 [archaeon]